VFSEICTPLANPLLVHTITYKLGACSRCGEVAYVAPRNEARDVLVGNSIVKTTESGLREGLEETHLRVGKTHRLHGVNQPRA
jgi:hypothetical protein